MKITINIIIIIPIVEYYGAIKNNFIDLYLWLWKDVPIIQVKKTIRATYIQQPFSKQFLDTISKLGALLEISKNRHSKEQSRNDHFPHKT